MKTLKKVLFYVLVSTLLLACKKEQAPASEIKGQPVFSFNGTVNGSSVNLQAGINDYYMYSSCTQDANNVYNFTGTLQNISTSNNSIQIVINDSKVSAANASVVIDTSLVTTYYSFNIPGGNVTSYLVEFIPILGSSAVRSAPFSWVFGDGGVSNADTVYHLYTHPGNYNASLSAQLLSGCTTNISNVISVGNGIVNITGIVVTGIPGALDFIAGYTGSAKTFSWAFGDGTIANTTIPTTSHTYTTPGMYLITLTIIDANNNSTVFNQYIVTSGYTTQCVVNYGTIITAQSNPLSLSNITIIYTDANGIVYTSNNASQPSTSTFQILSVADYQNNRNNQPTKEIKVQFNCMLYNGSKSIPANGIATIAVAYK